MGFVAAVIGLQLFLYQHSQGINVEQTEFVAGIVAVEFRQRYRAGVAAEVNDEMPELVFYGLEFADDACFFLFLFNRKNLATVMLFVGVLLR